MCDVAVLPRCVTNRWEKYTNSEINEKNFDLVYRKELYKIIITISYT